MPTLLTPTQLGPLFWNWSRTLILGVVNVTPDSFSDGGKYCSVDKAIEYAMSLVEAGADVIDIGGESTRHGSTPVTTAEEKNRVLPVVRELIKLCATPISIDTYKAEVAHAAMDAGASIINDISGFGLDPDMSAAVVETGATVILGHLRGRPSIMQEDINFSDVVGEVITELKSNVRRAIEAGVRPERIWVDPGIGFGKTPEQSIVLLKASGRIREEVGYPLLVGPSRKSFIGAITGQPAKERLMGTCAAVAAVIMAGADGVRIHDVHELQPAIKVADGIRRGRLNLSQ